MIVVAIGSNLALPALAEPVDVCAAAVAAMPGHAIDIVRQSRWYRTTPVPASGQPDFVNGAVVVRTSLSPGDLMTALHAIEMQFGRKRSVPNAARTLDLDLIAYDDIVRNGPGTPVLPHPRMAQRAFVLKPMAEIAPAWRHPVLNVTASELADTLGDDPGCVAISATEGA